MLYSLRQLLHKIGLLIGPGVLPIGQEESAVRDRNESISATDNELRHCVRFQSEMGHLLCPISDLLCPISGLLRPVMAIEG